MDVREAPRRGRPGARKRSGSPPIAVMVIVLVAVIGAGAW